MELKHVLKELEKDLKFTYLQRHDKATKEQIKHHLSGKRMEFEKFRLRLGEWAWKMVIDYEKRIEKAFNDQCENVAHELLAQQAVFDDIAIDCLGKNKIEERSKKLSGELKT